MSTAPPAVDGWSVTTHLGDAGIAIGASGAQGALCEISRDERAQRTRDLLAEAEHASPGRRAEIVEAVVLLNVRVADAVALRFRDSGCPMDDLRQTAYEGLVKAVQRYDPSAAEDLLTYAVPTIKGEVQRHLRDRIKMVRPPRRIQELSARIQAATAHLIEDLGREPSPGEICDYLAMPREEYEHVLLATTQLKCDSLDRPVTGEDDAATVGDLLPQEHVDEALVTVESRTILQPALRRLSERERRIVYLRFFEGRTQVEIAQELGISQANVAKILDRVMRRLRASMAEA